MKVNFYLIAFELLTHFKEDKMKLAYIGIWRQELTVHLYSTKKKFSNFPTHYV